MNSLINWEDCGDDTQRAKVPGGWLVRIDSPVQHINETVSGDGWDWRPALTFVPDPGHIWGIDLTNKSTPECEHKWAIVEDDAGVTHRCLKCGENY